MTVPTKAQTSLVAPVQSRWRRSSLAETDASDLASAACYRRPEHVGIASVVVPELKFRDVERHIFGTHLVESADDTALEDRPKAFNRIGVHRTDYILMFAVVNGRVLEVAQIVAVIASGVRRQQANLVRNGFIDEIEHGLSGHALQNSRDYIAVSLDCADDRRLIRCRAEFSLFPMAVFVFSANPRLVHFHDAAKLLLRGDQSRANLVAHGMGRLVAAEAHHALNLEGAHSLLAGKHQMGDAIPVAERLLGVLKNRADQSRKAIGAVPALQALPVKRLIARGVVQVRISAARAMNAFRPAPRHKVFQAGFVVPNRETGLKLGRRHLRDWFWLPCHSISPWGSSVGAYCHV
jgi:hypothetical protein